MLYLASSSTLAFVLASGCAANLDDIDARTRRLIQTTSDRTRAPSPDRPFPAADARKDAASLDTRPPTVNPPAGELDYAVADEARNVAERLEAYTRQSASGTPQYALTLTESLRLSQLHAPDFLAAEEEYVFAAIRLLIERHLWGPRLFNDTSVSIAGRGDQGSYQSAVRVLNDLRVTQRLPSGGNVQAQWLWDASEQLREQASGRYTQSSRLALSGDIPLLRGAGTVARESLIQAERNLVYAARTFEDFRRTFATRIARQYFDLVEAQSRLRNQERRVRLLEQITQGETARYEAGRIAEFRRNIAQNNLLSARAQLAGQREQFIVDLERFKILLGIPSQAPVALQEQELDLPEPEIGLDRATQLAYEYRLDLQNRRDQLDDQRRQVDNARNGVLPDASLRGRVGVPTDPTDRVGGLSFSPEDVDYEAGVTFGLPLDREQERLALRQAAIELQRAQREFDRFRDDLAVQVRQTVRQIDLARFQLTLAERQVEVNRRRVLETELKADEVDTQAKVDAANELQDSENARDRARTNLRNAVLEYLRQSGQLRVARDGTFEQLPGMEDPPVRVLDTPPAPAPDAPPPQPATDPAPQS